MHTLENTPDQNDDTENDITPEELSLLDDSINNINDGDDVNLKRSALDNTDEEGELLNEKSMADDISGEDLDVPGAEDDDHLEQIGEEDEENNSYSDADTD
jgi:hypothetical protein